MEDGNIIMGYKTIVNRYTFGFGIIIKKSSLIVSSLQLSYIAVKFWG
jgi:hypothetical protein